MRRKVEIKSIVYTKGSVIITSHTEMELRFGIIKDILILNNRKYFNIQEAEIQEYDNHFNAFKMSNK